MEVGKTTSHETASEAYDEVEKDPDTSRDAAATIVQRAWKRHRSAVLNPAVRWDDAVDHARTQTSRIAAADGKNDPKTRWRRGALLASRLQAANKSMHGEQEEEEDSDEGPMDKELIKVLEMQHWLELTDSKHRYGSNLLPQKMARRGHHRELFQVVKTLMLLGAYPPAEALTQICRLDRGTGKDLSLPECPREKLESERIVYLSAEQRLNYLVKPDDKGLLRWARNNELVDTTGDEWQDAGNGSGIVLSDGRQTKPIARRTSFESSVLPSNEDLPNGAEGNAHKDANTASKWWKQNFTPTGIVKKLLRRTIRQNTWIYVADKHINLYIGIKDTGAFQHSSFLAGGQVASAGLISVHNGLIHKLSPLSGHYRTRRDNFKKFVKVLEDKGVDMRRAEVGMGQVALWGVEHINKAKKSKAALAQKEHEYADAVKDKVPGLQAHAKAKDGSSFKDIGDDAHEVDSRWRRDVLLGRAKHDVNSK